VTRRALDGALASAFAPEPESAPATVAGLINGVAIGAPLLVGVATHAPEPGALATLGAYVGAFTNKGGPRWSRTRGLLAAAVFNAAAFRVGESVAALFPLALVTLLGVVFLAAMGSNINATVDRLGTMPATALLAGTVQTAGTDTGLRQGALLVLFGGIWYAAVTAVLTPAPRLQSVLAVVAQPYRGIGRNLLALAGPPAGVAHVPTSDALRKAEDTTRELRGPRGDEHLADLVEPVVRHAATLTDLTAALAVAGSPPAAIAAPYTTLATRAALQLAQLADRLALGRVPSAESEIGTALAALEAASDRMRAQTATGAHEYADMVRGARQRRLLERVTVTIDAFQRDAATLPAFAATRLHPPTTPAAHWDAAHLRAIMRPSSGAFRHAMRTTTLSAAVFILVQAAALPHGSWAVLAVLRVLRPQYAVTRERAVQRVAGNLIGGTCAALLIAAVHQPDTIAVILFVIITAGFTLRPLNYAFWVVFGTPLVLLIGDVSHPGNWVDAFVRIALTVLGTTAALLGSRLLWPSWEHPRLMNDADQARRATAAYLEAALHSLTEPAPDSVLRQVRITADKAVSRAQTTARHARHEPGHDTAAVDRAVTVVDLVNSLIPLIAALTAHRGPQTAHIPAITQYAEHAVPALSRGMTEEETVEHLDALSGTVDEMSLHLEELHTRRRHELAAGLSGDTEARAWVREHQPVIELLNTIAGEIRQIWQAREQVI
jgi:uncharacterized membrane protein YccC